ncbi:ABC transporter permease subunit [Clostridium swellfunianum]|uniref:ABC transporter permease subunit n=1 Tax=Clostridium swellfunianum TaxID=1367462 RepID=UPI00202ECEE5|nr:ABC transporter permease subunit [Clostridium swellfunianum]MCM0648293.1 ABC transporter permease subunit [Clostridium swellfunianum]
MLAILGKEFKAYFYSATGYVFMGVFLLIGGIFFANYNLIPASPLYSNVLSSMTFVFLLLVPIITMKLLAEEKHQKTDQLLLTSPLSIGEIVVGKYLASVALFFVTLAVTILFPLILSMYGKVPVGEIAATYIGFALMGAAFISVGAFVSSLTENQVVSAVASFGLLLFIWILDWIQQSFPADSKSGIVFAGIIVLAIAFITYHSTKNIILPLIELLAGAAVIAIIYLKNAALFEGFIPNFFGWISLTKRFQNFSMGILDLGSIVFYITFSIAFVYLAINAIQKRRWS